MRLGLAVLMVLSLGRGSGLHLLLSPRLRRLVPSRLHSRSPLHQRSHWTPASFPFLGSSLCGTQYHQPASPARAFLCDPDQLLGRASAAFLSRQMQPWWGFCDPLPRRPRPADDAGDEDEQPVFKLGMGVARVFAVAPPDSDCLPLPPFSSPARPAHPPSHHLLQTTAHDLRERWSLHADCRIDLLLLLSQRTLICNGTWREAGLTLALALSSPLSTFLNSSGEPVWSEPLAGPEWGREWQAARLVASALSRLQDAHEAATSRASAEASTSVVHSVPVWAWVLFLSSSVVSLGCAYFGHSINAGGSLAFLVRRSHTRRGGSGGWGAGFGGGMLEMRSGGAGGTAPANRSRRGFMGGMMSKPNRASTQGAGGRF